MKQIDNFWYRKSILPLILLPLAWLYCIVITIRKWLYKLAILKCHRIPVPVVVVGNISVGGTGKTPLVVYLCSLLQSNGYQPGVVSRGYRGKAKTWPQFVDATTDPLLVGDEAVLLARRCRCPMVVGPDRVEAATALLDNAKCNIILSDDGLQHYALARDIEIAVIDSQRRFGNGYCLPAGPLREPTTRLQSIDFAIVNGSAKSSELSMKLQFQNVINLKNQEHTMPVQEFTKTKVHAIAGIGNPQRFFEQLKDSGLDIISHVFVDHHNFSKQDILFNDNLAVIMTEKDAVKCQKFAQPNHWYVPVNAKLDPTFDQQLLQQLRKLNG